MAHIQTHSQHGPKHHGKGKASGVKATRIRRLPKKKDIVVVIREAIIVRPPTYFVSSDSKYSLNSEEEIGKS